MTRNILLILFVFICFGKLSAQYTQKIRGVVIDNASNAPVSFATVAILKIATPLGTVTDTLGNFMIPNIPIGRYDVQVSLMGYEPSIIREINVASAKETFLTITLKQNTQLLNEVTIRPNVNKEQALNSMSTVSARMLSVDEAKRYAGGFDDPARLASSFAGVASNNGNNGIIVRGNNPKFLQWKMEGVEIPNPNHFADVSVFGGGGLTAISSQLLANSDFFTGAMPAEYGNALSGVFDIFMRNGNNQKHEHTFQMGIIGIDAASEGPIKKGNGASYLFNYRYSTLGLIMPLLPKTSDGVVYQDLSFKLNFPTKKAGTFSLWGIGLIDHSGATEKTDSTKWFYDSDKQKQDAKQFMGAAGITHKYFFNSKTFIKTNLAATVSGIDFKIDKLNSDLKLSSENSIFNKNWNFVLSSFINKKISAKHNNKTGIVLTGLMYDILLKNSLQPNATISTLVDEKGFSSLLSAYTESAITLAPKLTINVGLNAQIFTLNKHYTVEPRVGLKYQFKPTQSLALAYGMHSRLERLNYYFTKDFTSNNQLYNKKLDFTKAHHLVLSYNLSITEHLHLKAEAYYQQLYNVPVIADSSFSFINLQADWFFNYKLENTGKGRNYGLDLSIEKYLSQGYYFMFTGSLFNSEYAGGDLIWRNTKFNRNYLLNFLIGKEWQLGNHKQNVLSANIRFSYQGGDRYSPLNITQSLAKNKEVLDETNAFAVQYPSSFLAHATISYKINKQKTAHEIAIKIINTTQQKDFEGYQYNYIKHTIDAKSSIIFIPNISYKIEF